MSLTAEDTLELQNILGRYCVLIDKGDAAWADLFTEDGVLAGIMPEPIVGREALRHVPGGAFEQTGGFFRHLVGSISIAPAGEGRATVSAYNLVTDWRDGGKIVMLARYHITAVRTADGWRLQHVDTQVDK
jgi:ketosteroid isomerase-like protein